MYTLPQVYLLAWNGNRKERQWNDHVHVFSSSDPSRTLCGVTMTLDWLTSELDPAQLQTRLTCPYCRNVPDIRKLCA